MGPESHYTPEGKLYIRKSMLEDFNFCPLWFKKTWLEHQARSVGNIMRMGTRFHEFAKRFFDFYAGISPERWEEFIPREFIPEEVDMAKWFIQHERERYSALIEAGRADEFMPVRREVRMVSDTLLLEGGLDRIDWFDKSKNQLCAIEYKTGMSINDESVTRQLAFYTLLWGETMTLGDIVKLQVINPRMQVVRTYDMHSWHSDKVISEVGKLRTALKTGVFPSKCSDVKYIWCQMCRNLVEAGLMTAEEHVEKFCSVVASEADNWRFSDIYEAENTQ